MVEPGGILGQIAAAKRDELAQRYVGVSLEALRHAAVPTRLSLAAAIARPGARFILEVKRGSPSQGELRTGLDPAAIARGYAGVADALSVLADRHFGGSLDDLRAARSAFDGPILAKDFMIDLRQVAEARIAGADAILVILSLLDDTEARAMIDEARRLGMDALVEVHDETEMRRALALDAPLIGINNRNLKDLTIDLAATERLAPLARGRLLVAESGIADRGDIDRLAPHVAGFLIGTSLMRAPDPAAAARALLFGRVKLCGLNRAEDFTAGAAASFAGMLFVPESPRAVTLDQAEVLLDRANHALRPVGVFRNAPIAGVADTVARLGLHAVQLHGDESAGDIANLRRRIPDQCEIWGAASVGSLAPTPRLGVDRSLFDSGSGGSGRTFDWDLLNGHRALGQSLVAGGIGPANAARAAALGAYAIDVGSALDERPGVKSPQKIAALFEALRTPAERELAECA